MAKYGESSRTLAAALLFLIFAAPAAAAPLDGHLLTTSISQIKGDGAIAIDEPRIFSTPSAAKASTTIEATTAWEVWNFPVRQTVIRLDDGNLYREQVNEEPTLVETGQARRATAQFNHAEDSLLAATLTHPVRVTNESLQLEIHPPAPIRSQENEPASHIDTIKAFDLRPAGQWIRIAGNTGMNAPLEPDALIAIYGAAIHFSNTQGNRTVETGSQQDPSRSTSIPGGPSTNTTNHFIALLRTIGPGTIQHQNWSPNILTHRIEGVIDGEFTWRGAESNLTLDGQQLEPTNHILQTQGNLEFTATSQSPWIDWTLDGNVQGAAINGVTIAIAATAAAGTLAAIYAGLLQILAATAKETATFILGKSTPRFARAGPLDNATRRTIIAKVHESRLATVTQITQTTGLSRPTVRYHLRILLSHGIFQTHVAQGLPKLHAYSLNSSSLKIPLDGMSQPHGHYQGGRLASEALAAIITHPVRQQIMEQLNRTTPTSFSTLLRRINQPTASSSLSDHLKILLDNGAIEAEGKGSSRRFRARIDPELIAKQQLHRFLRATRLEESLTAARQTLPAPRKSLLQAIKGTRNIPEDQARTELDFLVTLGLVPIESEQAQEIHAETAHNETPAYS